MIEFIIGEKGKGKTKVLLEKANREVKEATGNVVYLDKDTLIASTARDNDRAIGRETELKLRFEG